MRVLPFDAHNHVHMGPSDPLLPLDFVSSMAIMSTHPRDFGMVQSLAQTNKKRIVPCFGVHPWFLHELDGNEWIDTLRSCLEENPSSIVGEIGLDGFHFDAATKELSCPMDRQVEAFTLQLELAAELNRPVSIHSVQSFGQLMNILSNTISLPPKLYFHAFGGKLGTIDQILALCGNRDVYFGFAPVVNFRSPKTPAVIRKIGIERLLLETDHEDSKLVQQSMEDGIRYIAEALDVDEAHLIEATTKNAKSFYGLDDDI